MSGDAFFDGNGITPGTEGCNCDPDCEFPCWQRIGIAPACEPCGCRAFAETLDCPVVADEDYPWTPSTAEPPHDPF